MIVAGSVYETQEMAPAWLLHGDCRDVMHTLEPCSVDAIVSDPPYGLSFMGKGWDHGVPGAEFWLEALRVAKPGAHLLAFGGTRTYHRLACAIEDAGWEVRDCMMWIYGSGFPKSLDVSKAIATEAAKHWEGWGTALKPAWEPIIVARKPLAGTVAANVLQYGTGAINVDGCRIPAEKPTGWGGAAVGGNTWNEGNCRLTKNGDPRPADGRWPANVMHDGSPEVTDLFPRVGRRSRKDVGRLGAFAGSAARF